MGSSGGGGGNAAFAQALNSQPGLRGQLATLMSRGGSPNPGNPAAPQVPSPGPTLARPAMAAATPAQMAMPAGAAGRGGGWMGYNGTGTGDWNYATQGQSGNVPGQYNYAGFNVSHGVGDDPAKGQVSSLSLPGTAGMLARPAGPQMGFLPRPGG